MTAEGGITKPHFMEKRGSSQNIDCGIKGDSRDIDVCFRTPEGKRLGELGISPATSREQIFSSQKQEKLSV